MEGSEENWRKTLEARERKNQQTTYMCQMILKYNASITDTSSLQVFLLKQSRQLLQQVIEIILK
jgi:hypothetical protein